jgi:hypothetical protein
MPNDAAAEASDPLDSNVAETARHEGGGHHDAGVEAGADTAPPVDGGTDSPITADVVTPPVDSGHDAGHDSGPPPPPPDAGCTPFVAKSPNVCGMGAAPETFCTFFDISSSYLATTTPPACQCDTTFTCACLYANGVDTSAFCAGGGKPTKCTDNANSGPSVECP